MPQAIRMGGIPMRVVEDPDNPGAFILAFVQLDANGNVTSAQGTTEAFADEAMTVSSTAAGPTESVYAPEDEEPATYAFVTVAGDTIRYRTSGGDPTSSVGHEVVSGGYFEVYGASNVANLRMIRSGSNDAEVYITYERPLA